MYENKLFEIVQSAQNNQITFQKASKEILIIIYKNTKRFKLGGLTPDEQSNFLIFIYPRLENILRKYDKKGSPFIVYLYRSIEILKFSWFKIKQQKIFYENCLNPEIINNYYEEESLNATRELTFSFSKFKSNVINITKGKSKTQSNSIRKAILVLTLKSCYFIDNTDIARISEFCRYNPLQLENDIIELKQTLQDKEKTISLYKKRRDRAYFYHIKYGNQLKNYQKNSVEYKKAFQKYSKHTALWKKKTYRLQNKMHLSPKNSDIAKVLGICERQVGYYIAYAKKMSE